MDLLWGLFLLGGFYPLGRAWYANRRTALSHTLSWALVAWLAWVGLAWGRAFCPGEEGRLGAYVALSLTGCAGIAVLGARRPGMAAWNFVVGGLLAVLLLPVLNGLGEVRLETAQALFLAVALAVPLVNYLPTRLAAGAGLVALGCAAEMTRLVLGEALPSFLRSAGPGLIALGPWAAWAGLRRSRSVPSAFDRLWLAHRDGFGFVWGQRVRDQFNRAVAHAGWQVELRWDGLHAVGTGAPRAQDELLAMLRAVCKRFGPEVERGEGGE